MTRDRKLLVIFAVGGFCFVNIILLWWVLKTRSHVGGRDEGIFVSSEIAGSIAHCSTTLGTLVPSSGPLPPKPVDFASGYLATGDELLPPSARGPNSTCTPAKLPWRQHWTFTWIVETPDVRGHLHATIDRDSDNVDDDEIDTAVVCTRTEGKLVCAVSRRPLTEVTLPSAPRLF